MKHERIIIAMLAVTLIAVVWTDQVDTDGEGPQGHP